MRRCAALCQKRRSKQGGVSPPLSKAVKTPADPRPLVNPRQSAAACGPPVKPSNLRPARTPSPTTPPVYRHCGARIWYAYGEMSSRAEFFAACGAFVLYAHALHVDGVSQIAWPATLRRRKLQIKPKLSHVPHVASGRGSSYLSHSPSAAGGLPSTSWTAGRSDRRARKMTVVERER